VNAKINHFKGSGLSNYFFFIEYLVILIKMKAMQKLSTFFLVVLISAAFNTSAQMFWVENFEGGSTGGLLVGAYTSPNGPWTLTVTGPEDLEHNEWYVSCAENGHTTGYCGTDCAPVSATATLSTLHVGAYSLSSGDNGAQYDNGSGPFIVTTDRRAESPTINCSGRYTITMAFYYIERGDLTNDDGSVWYSPDNGTTWSLLVNTPKTPPICPPSGTFAYPGYWDRYTVALPASANNNPTVKIGFRWVNNNDAFGTDPSFAIDSVSLTAGSSTSTPTPSFSVTPSYTVCQDSCIRFTNTSTGIVDSFRWSVPGVAISTPTVSPVSICFSVAGTYTATLTVWHAGTPYTATHTVTVNPAPHPVITRIGHTLSVSGAYTAYQWLTGATPISGATNSSYTFTSSATYAVVVDSAGCYGLATIAISTTGISGISLENKYWIAQPSHNSIDLYASEPLNEAVDISVYDPTGRQIITDKWGRDQNSVKINCADCTAGLYIIKLSGKNTSEVLKWVKQ
jgi:hypothetical protein